MTVFSKSIKSPRTKVLPISTTIFQCTRGSSSDKALARFSTSISPLLPKYLQE